MRRINLGILVVAAIVLTSTASLLAVQAQEPPAASKAPGAVVNLNTATAAQLESLPGVGPATAARIIEYRQKNGAFKKIEELMNVRGIGEKNFLKLKPMITVAPPKTERAGQTPGS